jgi:hypothetical protein
MVISREEAAKALNEISSANKRVNSIQHYRHLSPHLILWGFIWLVANTVTELWPANAGSVWNGLSWAGVVTSMWIGYRSKIRTSHPFAVNSAEAHGERGFRILLTMLTILGFFIATFAILPKLDLKQANAYISLFWGAYYMVVGIWTGFRMLLVGVLTTASILFAFFVIPQHYFLWMGLVTGSLLILGGIWLRKV